jgi:DNA-binding beta-propeller fold protein YncE
MKQRRTVILTTIIVLAIFLSVNACVKRVADEREPLPEIVWPKAPEIPRIRFVTSISRPEDLQIRRGAFKRFFDYLLGETKRSIGTPYGVEVDAAGRIYVVDTLLGIVHVFDVQAKKYHTFPTKSVTLLSPIDIAIDNQTGLIYVTDSKAGVVKLFGEAGKKHVGEIGKGIFERPTGIAINEKISELLVVDTQAARIVRYDLKDHNYKGLIGGGGAKAGSFHYPTNIYVARDGGFFISDSLNYRIQIFSPEGEFLNSFGSAGDGPGYFSRPRGVAVDSDDNIYVVDGLFDNVQMFDKEGRLLMAFGNSGRGYGEFWLPNGIFVDGKDIIYVSDSYNKRVQIFQYLKREDRSP